MHLSQDGNGATFQGMGLSTCTETRMDSHVTTEIFEIGLPNLGMGHCLCLRCAGQLPDK